MTKITKDSIFMQRLLHCLGLDGLENYHRKSIICYRNYFYNTDIYIDILVKKNYMKKLERFFVVTAKGVNFIQSSFGIEIIMKDSDKYE